MVEDNMFWQGVKLAFPTPSPTAPSMNGMQGAAPGSQAGGMIQRPKTAPPLGQLQRPAPPAKPDALGG